MIHFKSSDWDSVFKNFENWWEKKSSGALVGCMIKKYPPSGKIPAKPLLTQNNAHLNFTADEILDSIQYELSQYEFIGDAFPMFSMDCFGPGIVAAFLGCSMDNNNGRTGIWFRPDKKHEIAGFKPVFDAENPVYKRIREILKRAAERFEGKILVSMPDLGGCADILSSFFPGEELMLEMYDDPESVLAAISRIDDLWQKYYDDFSACLHSELYGYTDWSKTLSRKRSSVIQSDISYMLSHEMFETFIFESLKKHTERLDRTLFHMDGVGELKNLKDLLSLEKLDAIQWVPGDFGGKESYAEWMDVYNQILDADKLVQIFLASYEEVETIVRGVKKKGYIQQGMKIFPAEQREYAISCVERIKSL